MFQVLISPNFNNKLLNLFIRNQNLLSMKTKTLLLLCFIAAFTVNKVNAQNGVIKDEFTANIEELYLPCTGDYLRGTIAVPYKIMPHLFLQQPKDGVLTGESGKTYEVWQIIVNSTSKSDNWVSTGIIRLDGKIVARFKWQYHTTINANGVVTAEIARDMVFDC
jgi:hypothetical protein